MSQSDGHKVEPDSKQKMEEKMNQNVKQIMKMAEFSTRNNISDRLRQQNFTHLFKIILK